MKPDFKFKADGVDITAILKTALIDITVTDKKNLEADQLDIRLADPEGAIELPRKKVQIECWLGFEGQGLVYKGSYTVDELSHTGPPDQITIRARSANFSGGLKQERDMWFDGQTIGEILQPIATANGLDLAIEGGLKNTVIAHLDQTNESWGNLITRLAAKYDALATIKNKTLLFIPVGYSKTVSGIELSTLTIQRQGKGRHTFINADRNTDFTGVQAKWYDLNTGSEHHALAGAAGNLKTLKKIWPTKEEAEAAAKSKWRELSRSNKTMQIALPIGQPEIAPNSPVLLSGWRPEIDQVKWVVGNVTHKLGAQGLSTDVDLEELSSI